MNRFKSLGIGCILLAVSTSLWADGWAILSKHYELINHAIIDVGQVYYVSPPFNTNWDNDVYEFNGTCFNVIGYVNKSDLDGATAFMVADINRRIKLATIASTISQIEIELINIVTINCPADAVTRPLTGNSLERAQQQLEQQRLRIEGLMEQNAQQNELNSQKLEQLRELLKQE